MRKLGRLDGSTVTVSPSKAIFAHLFGDSHQHHRKVPTVTNFSLIICIYAKETPAYLAQCLESILAQTVMPDEMVIVKDGPLTDELDAIIDAANFPNEKKIIQLPQNMTQGPARAIGIENAKHCWVAIMDSDDICRPDRFEKQLAMIEQNPDLGLIGGQIAEFTDEPKNADATRAVPQTHDEIAEFTKKRNPFNQMTVMFRRDLAQKAGNYRYFPWFEDYDLWTRMIKTGTICANHPDILVDARTGSGMFARRRGTNYIRHEWRMLKQLKTLGYTTTPGFIRNAAIRLPPRLLPARALAALYYRHVRNKP